MNRHDARKSQRGQALVLFAISLVAILAMAGLVLDGGDAFRQRRDEQNAADLAAMAGGYAYLDDLVAGGTVATAAAAADAAARAVATKNGYTDAVAETTVGVVVQAQSLAQQSTVTVTVNRPHANNFAGVVGQSTWDVGVLARVVVGIPNAAYGAMPVIFNQKALDPDGDGSPGPFPLTPTRYDEPPSGDESLPLDETTFNWTIFCQANGNPCNADSSGVRDLIDSGGYDTAVYLGMDIDPLNAGSHTTLYDAVADQGLPRDWPVAIVDDSGALLGFAMFHLANSEGGSVKQLSGWFVTDLNDPSLGVQDGCAPLPVCPPASAGLGWYVVKLVE